MSGTSKKSELKLTGVARGSLEELRLDYQDYLRNGGLEEWSPDHPALQRFKAKRCATLEQVRDWVKDERRRASANASDREQTPSAACVPSVPVGKYPYRSLPSSQLVANGALSLLNLCCYLLDRQLGAQAAAFEREGGFTERLYRVRSQKRNSG